MGSGRGDLTLRSPFSSNERMVDVTDIPSGTKVKCPYTMKIFRVP